MIDDALFSRLSSGTAITAIVGTAIYPVRAPKNAAPPWIRWQRISRIADRDLAGIEGLAQTRVQVDCIAASYDGARDLAEAVRARLTNWQDAAQSVDDTGLLNSRDFYEQIGDSFYFTASLDFNIMHNE